MKAIHSIIIFLVILYCANCATPPKKIKDDFLYGTWYLAGEHCNDNGKKCKTPRKKTVVEFTTDGFIIINQNARVRRKFHVRGNYFKIEYDEKKIFIRKLSNNSFLTEEDNMTSLFMRVKG